MSSKSSLTKKKRGKKERREKKEGEEKSFSDGRYHRPFTGIFLEKSRPRVVCLEWVSSHDRRGNEKKGGRKKKERGAGQPIVEFDPQSGGLVAPVVLNFQSS